MIVFCLYIKTLFKGNKLRTSKSAIDLKSKNQQQYT